MESPQEKTTTPKPILPENVKQFLNKNWLALSLVAVLIAVLVWFNIKLNKAEKRNEKQKQEGIASYNLMIDSISNANMKLSTRLLSWAVRGELIRNNIEQVDLFFNSFIKENNIKRLDLIDPNTGKIIKSTDKKIEGDFISDRNIIYQADKGVVLDTAKAQIISPVMGLDSKIGVLVVVLEKAVTKKE